MKPCEKVRILLDDYADKLLSPESARSVGAHVCSCETCARELEGIRRVREAARALPESIEPPRDLWLGIAGRISGEVPQVARARTGRSPAWLRYAAAAAVVLAAALGAAFLLRRPAPPPALPEVPPAIAALSLQRAALRAMEADYGRARAELLPLLEQRRDLMSPETRMLVDRNLALIDQALKEIRAAVEKDPNNRQLMELLNQTYRQEKDLMRRAAALPAGA